MNSLFILLLVFVVILLLPIAVALYVKFVKWLFRRRK